MLAVLFTVGPLAHRSEGPPFTGKLNAPLGDRRYRVTAWITAGAPTLQAALKARAIDEVDADWYMSQADGSVTAGRDEDLALVKTMRKDGLQVFATVTNRATDRSSFDGKIVGAILASSGSRARQVQALVDLAVTKGYDGIDLDWEEVPVADRDAFSAFATELAAALHRQHRLLSVAVFPKTSEPGDWDTQKATDYAAVGKAVDEFKVMTYSYSGPWSGPGPQAPLDWTARVLSFALSVVPAHKIYMGLPFFGFDWHAGTATAVQPTSAAALIAREHFKVAHDAASGEADLSYTDGAGVQHVLYFQDRQAVAAKLENLRQHFKEIGGISIWSMGSEDPAFWSVIDQRLK